jgi:hypothetical protein
MKSKEIEVGKAYLVKVSGSVVPVRVTGLFGYTVGRGSREQFRDGWTGINTLTGRTVKVRSPQKFRGVAS